MRLRQADSSDVPQLALLNEQLVDDESHRSRLSRDELAARMAEWLAGDYVAYFFCDRDAVLGYALYREELGHRGDTGHVYLRQFYVCREHRRRGVGSAAIKMLRADVWGHKRLRIDVLVGNERALLFWRSLGFTDYCLTMELG